MVALATMINGGNTVILAYLVLKMSVFQEVLYELAQEHEQVQVKQPPVFKFFNFYGGSEA